MKKKILVEVEIDVNNNYCEEKCKFLNRRDEYCDLFIQKIFYDIKTDKYVRCKECIETERRKNERNDKGN